MTRLISCTCLHITIPLSLSSFLLSSKSQVPVTRTVGQATIEHVIPRNKPLLAIGECTLEGDRVGVTWDTFLSFTYSLDGFYPLLLLSISLTFCSSTRFLTSVYRCVYFWHLLYTLSLLGCVITPFIRYTLSCCSFGASLWWTIWLSCCYVQATWVHEGKV